MRIEYTRIAAVVVDHDILAVSLEDHARMSSIIAALEETQPTPCEFRCSECTLLRVVVPIRPNCTVLQGQHIAFCCAVLLKNDRETECFILFFILAVARRHLLDDAVQGGLPCRQRDIGVSFLTRLDIAVDDHLMAAVAVDRNRAIAVADGPSAAHRILVQLYMQPIRFNRCASTRDEPLRSLVALRLDIEITLDCDDRAVLIIAYAKSTTVAALYINLQRIRRDLYAILAVVVHTEDKVAAVADQGQLMLPCIDIEQLFWIGCCCDDAVIGASANRRVLRELVIAGRRLDIGRLVLGNFLLCKLRGELRLCLFRAWRRRCRTSTDVAAAFRRKGNVFIDGGGRQSLTDREFAFEFPVGEILVRQLIGKRIQYGVLIGCCHPVCVGKECENILSSHSLADDNITSLKGCWCCFIMPINSCCMAAVIIKRHCIRILLVDDAACGLCRPAIEIGDTASADIDLLSCDISERARADVFVVLIVARIAPLIQPCCTVLQIEIRRTAVIHKAVQVGLVCHEGDVESALGQHK